MKSAISSLFSKLIVGFTTFALMAPVAMADEGIGEKASNLDENLGGVAQLVLGLFFLIGVALVGGGLLKLKAHKDNPQGVPLSQPITMLIIGGLLTVVIGIIGVTQSSFGIGDDDSDDVTRNVQSDRENVKKLFK
jgi:phosphotransferase system  glucose/maltose/N-acetylglucosamine-specific IIC component